MSMRLIRQVSFLWIAFGYLLVSVSIDAAPYNGDIFYLKQPDGTRVAVAVWGDEFYQHVEDVNGYTLVRDDQYRICYAQVTRNGSKLTATDVVYRENGYATAITELQKRGISKGVEISPQAQYQARLDMIQLRSKYATSPLNKRGNGNPKLPKEVRGLTMCIDFSDCPATIPVAKIDSLANGSQFFEFGNNGSVYQYFKEVSAGKMEYKNIVVGYLRAPKPKSYYDDTATDGLKALELVRWAAQFTRDSLKIKFDSLTSDDSGYVYACNVYYAGNPDNGWAKGLWPHSWNLDTMVVSGIKKIFAYQMTNVGNDISIGTFVHENCHMVLNLPDLYSYYGTSRGVGRYCVMCANDKKNPQTLCAPFRGWMGWIDAIDISSVTAPTAYKCFSNTNQAYLYRNKKDSCEYFVIESRLRKGRSGMLLDQGLLIWHVDTNKARTGGNLPNLPWGNHLNQMKPDSHYLVSVEQANNLYNLEHNIGFGAYGDLYHARTSNRFNDYTTPSSHWWNDSLSGLTLTNISACGDTMDFAFGELPFSVTAPVSNDTLWANTAGFITWKSLDKSLLQVKIEISYDNGKTFSSLTSAIDNSGIYKWTVPQVRSTSCVLRFKDMADSVKYQTGRFSILFGTAIVANPGSVEASIAKNNSKDIDVVVQNAGNGVVSFKAESKYLSQMVLINEFYMGSIQKFPMNGVELYNRGPEVDLSNWKLHWVDNAGTSMTYTFPSGSKIRAGSTVVATKENSSPNDSTFFIGQSVFWRSGTLKLAIVLKNSANIAVDYVQIGGDTTIAGLKGISWNGVNVPINAGFFKKDLAFVMRKGTVNHFSAEDWVMDTVGGTINALNAGQKNSMNPKPWLTLEQSSGVLDSFLMKKVTLHYMTKELGLGILRDTIYISHNAAAQPSPLVVPCRIEIVPVTANSKKTDKNSSFFIVGPENPLSKRGFSTLTFTFSDKECKAVRLSIFDALGNCIKSVPMNGSYTWDLKNLHGKTVGSGVYEAVLSVTYKDGTSTMFEKMIGIKE